MKILQKIIECHFNANFYKPCLQIHIKLLKVVFDTIISSNLNVTYCTAKLWANHRKFCGIYIHARCHQ